MTGTKSVLVVGLDPALVDLSKPGYAPGMTVEKGLAFYALKFGQPSKQTVNFHGDKEPLSKTFVGNFVDACGVGASKFFRHYSFALRHSLCGNPSSRSEPL